MLVFDNTEDINKIYGIKQILGIVVKIEALRKVSSLIPQCKRCQGYNHTQRFCQLEPRCVRCAGKHHTKECLKSKDSSPTCVNCHEHHPASYRGCEVAKTLQKKRNDTLRLRQGGKNTVRKHWEEPQGLPVLKSTQSTTNVEKEKSTNTTYAQVASENKQEGVEELLKRMINKLDEQDKNIKIILERLHKLETSSKRTAANKRN